jgi:hypothetical protein
VSLRAEQIVAILERHQVRYLIIGGLAAVLHGSPIVTAGADICPARDGENLRRLAEALRDLRARLRVEREPEDVAFPFESAFLANVQVLNLTTPYGDLDLSYVPSGTEGYDDLVRNASNLIIAGCRVQVASLDDVIRSKEAANREKDRATLPTLRLHQRMLRERKGAAIRLPRRDGRELQVLPRSRPRLPPRMAAACSFVTFSSSRTPICPAR